MQSFKSLLRKIFFRSRMFRVAAGFLGRRIGSERGLNLEHLAFYRENVLGPVQRDEALFLFSVLQLVRPRVVVEFGFLHGMSAFNFLQALSEDARLFSYEVDPTAALRARNEFARDPRFRLLVKSQQDFHPADVGCEPIDFLFFDGTHEFEVNCATFRSVLPSLSPHAIVAIHDTGLWSLPATPTLHSSWATHDGGWISPDLFAHQAGERKFANHILTEYPEFSLLHFHSERTFRNGLSLIQKKRHLVMPQITRLVRAGEL